MPARLGRLAIESQKFQLNERIIKERHIHRYSTGLMPIYGYLHEGVKQWVWMDLNHRPHPYQGRALTS